MAHGINANIEHGWRKLAREASGPVVAAPTFVPVRIEVPAASPSTMAHRGANAIDIGDKWATQNHGGPSDHKQNTRKRPLATGRLWRHPPIRALTKTVSTGMAASSTVATAVPATVSSFGVDALLGVPFFFGRNIYFGIEGQSANTGGAPASQAFVAF